MTACKLPGTVQNSNSSRNTRLYGLVTRMIKINDYNFTLLLTLLPQLVFNNSLFTENPSLADYISVSTRREQTLLKPRPEPRPLSKAYQTCTGCLPGGGMSPFRMNKETGKMSLKSVRVLLVFKLFIVVFSCIWLEKRLLIFRPKDKRTRHLPTTHQTYRITFGVRSKTFETSPKVHKSSRFTHCSSHRYGRKRELNNSFAGITF